jgi:hypothetical protein
MCQNNSYENIKYFLFYYHTNGIMIINDNLDEITILILKYWTENEIIDI